MYSENLSPTEGHAALFSWQRWVFACFFSICDLGESVVQVLEDSDRGRLEWLSSCHGFPYSTVSLSRAATSVYLGLSSLLDCFFDLCFVFVSIKYCHWETFLTRNKATSVLGHISLLTMKTNQVGIREERVASLVCVGSLCPGV